MDFETSLGLGLIGFTLVTGAIYMTPTIIAFQRRHPNRWIIAALNLMLGATGIAWLGCLIWSLGILHVENPAQSANNAKSGLGVFVNDAGKSN